MAGAIVTVDPSLPVGFEVRSRTGRLLTTLVPELAGLAELGFRMVLDGELVSVGEDDNSTSTRSGNEMLTGRATRTVTLCAFDVLWLDGIDCTQLPLSSMPTSTKGGLRDEVCTYSKFRLGHVANDSIHTLPNWFSPRWPTGIRRTPCRSASVSLL